MRAQSGEAPFPLLFRWLQLLLLYFAFPSAAFPLSTDESLLLERVRAIAAAPIDDFSLLGETKGAPDGHYRYQLAFLSYSLCSIVEGEPSLRPEAHRLFIRLLEKMQHPTTTAYWRRLGYAGEGITKDNAMYRGHLNLMYALAHDRFGETRFDDRFHALSRTLFDELNGKCPLCCEPDQLFVQCNSVIVLSLWLHDRAFATEYAANGNRLLAWARQHMPLDGTTLVREDYHPSTGRSSAGRSGYANAWTIAFLAPVPGLQSDLKNMYADWRRVFLEDPPLHLRNG
jgi:hypothetical protein